MTKLRTNAIENIKKQYLLDAIKSLSICIISFLALVGILMVCLNDITNIDGGTGFMMIFLLAIFAFLAYGFGKSAYMYFYYYANPYKCNICRIYGNIDKIIAEINSTYEYEDSEMIIAKNYIIAKNDFRKLFSYSNILGIYTRVHKTNFVVDKYSIVVSDKYNNIELFDYSPTKKHIMEETLSILIPKCKNARFGYTNETLQYIKDNIVPIPDYEENNIKMENNVQIYNKDEEALDILIKKLEVENSIKEEDIH